MPNKEALPACISGMWQPEKYIRQKIWMPEKLLFATPYKWPEEILDEI